MNNESYILRMLIDPDVKDITGGYLTPSMFNGDANRNFLKAIKQDKYKGVVPDARVFAADYGNQNGITEDDINTAVDYIKNHEPLMNGKLAVAVDAIEEFVKHKRVMTAMQSYLESDDKGPEIANSVKSAFDFSIRAEAEEFVNPSNLDEIIKARQEELPEGGKIIKSHFNLINKCSQYGGYKYGDLNLIVAKPGGGKTTVAINEAACFLKQGLKIAVLYLGDMSDFDASVKFLSVLNESPVLLSDVAAKVEDYHTDKTREYLQNLRFKAMPALKYDVFEITAKLNKLYKKFPYDVVIIDYDSNIKETNDMMYKDGGLVYSHLKGFSQGRCVTFILSQPKQHYWNQEVIPLEAAAESSRKQHAVDYMINIGVNKECSRVGTAHLAKIRRGASNMQSKLRFDGIYGRIIEIDMNEYNEIVQQESDNNSTDDYDKVSEGFGR